MLALNIVTFIITYASILVFGLTSRLKNDIFKICIFKRYESVIRETCDFHGELDEREARRLVDKFVKQSGLKSYNYFELFYQLALSRENVSYEVKRFFEKEIAPELGEAQISFANFCAFALQSRKSYYWYDSETLFAKELEESFYAQFTPAGNATKTREELKKLGVSLALLQAFRAKLPYFSYFLEDNWHKGGQHLRPFSTEFFNKFLADTDPSQPPDERTIRALDAWWIDIKPWSPQAEP